MAWKEVRSVMPLKYPVSPKRLRTKLPNHNGLLYVGALPTA